MKTYEIKVAPEDVTETVNKSIAQGWKFVNSEMLPDGKMRLIFDTSASASAPITGQPYNGQSYVEKKKSNPNQTLQAILLLLVAVCGALYFATGAGKGKNDKPTQTVTASRPIGPAAPPTREVFTASDLPNHVSDILDNMNFEVTSIQSANGSIVAYAPSTSDQYDEAGDYRMAYIGAFSGALINFFNDVRTNANPPQTVTINFGNGRQVLVRITYQYSDAMDYYNGKLTASQFLAKWEID